jgi:hypothetical protein
MVSVNVPAAWRGGVAVEPKCPACKEENQRLRSTHSDIVGRRGHTVVGADAGHSPLVRLRVSSSR